MPTTVSGNYQLIFIIVLIGIVTLHLPLDAALALHPATDLITNLSANTQDQIIPNDETSENNDILNRHSRELTRLVSKKCRCGVQQAVPTKKFRIVGGVESEPHSRPWMVALVTKRNYHFCGGALVNNRYVLTAAHCVYRQRPSRVFVVLGLHDKMNVRQVQAGRRSISQIMIHPNYDKISVDNDIALLQISTPIEVSNTMAPVCLPQMNANHVGCNGTVTGWGAVADNSQVSSDILREVALPIITLRDCKSKFPPGEITDNMLCAGYEYGGRDACQGDSGGPMIIEDHGRWYLIAVVSWGNGCAIAHQPGIYTNVSKYINWIYRNTQSAVYCW